MTEHDPIAHEFRATRGVQRHHLFDCLGRARTVDRQELTATYGHHWSDDDLAKSWTSNQADGLTIWCGSLVVACAVAWENLPGHWTCGMIASEQWSAVAKPASRYLKRYLRPVLMGQRVRRVSCVVDLRHSQAVRWLSFLGFEPEATLRAYGTDGRDFLMMAMLPKNKRSGDEHV